MKKTYDGLPRERDDGHCCESGTMAAARMMGDKLMKDGLMR